MMKFFFPDSHDLVDPSFNFESEERSSGRIRHQHDLYAHEVYPVPPYDGLLLSKAIVDGTQNGAGKYTSPQRQRLLRTGVRDFFRLGKLPIDVMGDCGAFAYVREKTPPYSVEEVLDFYEQCRFDHGVSVDHVILGFTTNDKTAGDNAHARQGLPESTPQTKTPVYPGRRGPGMESSVLCCLHRPTTKDGL